MTFKQKIYEHCRQLLHDKIQALQDRLQELHDSAANETKSTAGDKHETALAMLQIEQENTRRQLSDATDQKSILDRIDISIISEKMIQGSLAKTDRGFLFVSLGFGKITVDDFPVITLSPASPLGKKLMGCKVNELVEMNGTTYTIEQIG